MARGELPEKPDLLWTFSTANGGFESTAAIVEGSVYIGCTDGKLYALNLQTGEKRWEFSTPLGFVASAAVRGGRVYIGDSDGLFYCLEAATRQEAVDFQTDAEIDSSANFHGDHVLFGSQDSTFIACRPPRASWSGSLRAQDQIRCFPTVVDNLGFVAGCDGQLHAIDLAQGKGVGEVKIDSPTGSSPAVMGGIVFVGTEGHTFFAIDPRRSKILGVTRTPSMARRFVPRRR